MITLLNVQRQAGKFKIQVGDGRMELRLPNKEQDHIFEVNKNSALQLYRVAISVFERDSGVVECQLHSEELTLDIRMELDSTSRFVDVEIDGERLGEQIVFPLISFRISEVIKLQSVLERYWKIFTVPAVGDVLDNPIDAGWADNILWNFPIEAVNQFTVNCLSSPEDWDWTENSALVVATNNHNTWYAIQRRNGQFAWLTKTFE